MGYEFICGIPVAVVAGLAIAWGLFIMLERLEDWAATRINKNRRKAGSSGNPVIIRRHGA